MQLTLQNYISVNWKTIYVRIFEGCKFYKYCKTGYLNKVYIFVNFAKSLLSRENLFYILNIILLSSIYYLPWSRTLAKRYFLLRQKTSVSWKFAPVKISHFMVRRCFDNFLVILSQTLLEFYTRNTEFLGLNFHIYSFICKIYVPCMHLFTLHPLLHTVFIL